MDKYTNKIQLHCDNEVIENTFDDYDVLKYYPSLKLLKTADYYDKKYQYKNAIFYHYCCFNYAFKRKNLYEIEQAYDILINKYTPILKNEAVKGDIISFHNLTENKEPTGCNCYHFAIISDIYKVKDISNNAEKVYIKIKSKFGCMGVFEGSIDLLPQGYGNSFVIWRRNKIFLTEKKTKVNNEIGSF